MSSTPENKPLLCPGCGGNLKDVYAEANYGRVLLLDQCEDCGGIWFDRWELYFLKTGAARRLAGVDPSAVLAENPLRVGSGECPRCKKGLAHFHDILLPKDASIKRCPGCSGLWLNRGELTKYADHKDKTVNGKGAKALNGAGKAEIEQAELKALKEMQKELDTDGLLRAAHEPGPLDEPPIKPEELKKDIAVLILHTILRLVFKF